MVTNMLIIKVKMRWTYGQKVLTIVMNDDVHHGEQDVCKNGYEADCTDDHNL